ncbi:MAG TPA: hypothetical protein VI357_10385 [Mycobacteriales bacterium]
MSEDPDTVITPPRGPFGTQPAREAVYGVLVCGSLLATGTRGAYSVGRVALGILGTVVVYWLGHVYVDVISSRAADREVRLMPTVRHAAVLNVPLLQAPLIPLAVLLATRLLGAGPQAAVWAGLLATVAIVVTWGLIIGAGSRRRRALSAAIATALGIAMILLKAALH